MRRKADDGSAALTLAQLACCTGDVLAIGRRANGHATARGCSDVNIALHVSGQYDYHWPDIGLGQGIRFAQGVGTQIDREAVLISLTNGAAVSLAECTR